MRFFSVELTPAADGKSWEAYAGSLPDLSEVAPTPGAHEEGFFIAPQTMPVGEAFEALRSDILQRLTREIAQLTESALALAEMPAPKFAPIHWNETADTAAA